MIRGTRIPLAVALIILALLSTGCWFGTGSTSDVRYKLSDEIGMELEPEFGMRAGRITLGFARFGLKLAGEDQVSLKGLKKVEVGVYNVTATTDGGRGVTDLDFPDWQRVVRVKERGEEVLVLVRVEDEQAKIKAMMVLVHDDDELVVVRARGKIHKLIKNTLKQHGWADIHRSFDDSVDIS